jgi:cytochrome c oxidase cbb3-type subunit 3/ubiquinol-cytochrome c reductase cytochrome c subunit
MALRIGRRLGLLFALLFAFSCGSHSPEPQANAPSSQAKPGTTTVTERVAAQQKHGAELYAHICAVCHGKNGEGYKADRAPALAQQDFLASVNNWFLRSSIARGRTGTTMSAWAKEHGGPLSSDDIDALVAFIRSWQKKPRVTLDERPLRGDAKRAEPVYAAECAKCHGERGIGGQYIRIGDPALLSSVSMGFLRYAIANGRPGTPMPAFAQKLGPEGVDDMVTLVYGFMPAPPPQGPAVAAPPQITAPLPLGKIPLNPGGPEPVDFEVFPKTTPGKQIHDQLVRGAKMALLDARAPSDYVTAHISGAVSVPFYDPSPYLDKLPKNTWLVSYCACPHAESGELAQKLLDHGFKKVTVLAEGLGYWQSQGWKTKTGKEQQ